MIFLVIVPVHFLVLYFLTVTLNSEAYVVPPTVTHILRPCSFAPIRLAATTAENEALSSSIVEQHQPSSKNNNIHGLVDTTTDENSSKISNTYYDSIFEAIAHRAATCLYQSDLRRDAVGKAAGKQGSSATNWIDDASAFALQQTLSRLRLETNTNGYSDAWKRDETLAWRRWMRSIPVPTIIDLSSELGRVMDVTLKDENLQQVDQKRHEFVAAPELLDRWVGGSEKLVRLLFADAEAELRACGGDATKSALHVVVIDEIDAVFRKRSSAEDSGEATRSSVVNQILAKLDGVNSIPNLLLIGMTNRRELLDGALLRPGRLEVQVEIPLPDALGRREILNIHFNALRQRGRLSHPLCCAIDGVSPVRTPQVDEKGVDSNMKTIHSGRKRRAVRQVISRLRSTMTPIYDLANDAVTGGFSGADIAGLVRCAGSLALARCRRDGSGVEALLITLEDVQQALAEVK